MALTKCLLPAVPLVTQGVSSPLLQEEIRLFWQMVVNVSRNFTPGAGHMKTSRLKSSLLENSEIGECQINRLFLGLSSWKDSEDTGYHGGVLLEAGHKTCCDGILNFISPCIFFLSNLSFLDICYSTSWEPYVLAQCFRDFPIIFYTSCYAQMTTSLFPGMTECLFHAVMVYDRFVAISNPLHYTTIMNNEVCIQLALGIWASAFLVAVLPFIAIPACYYGQNAISHFTCEIQAPLKLICSDTPVSLILGLVISVFILTLPFTIILISYFHIVVIVLRIHSVEASLKSFFICGPYLTVVNIFNGIAIYMYLKPQRNLRKRTNSSQYFF
ncbi:olfactory receptor 13H1-like [Herpailurus yagouaroundi]|uniref:olfactory receptor 13H1-like n=1 Tax=Herpailurus yagouaroundi TaxID=1608482 RepID=UPI001AD61251|nr:olfactory receptor 13H1-like [Puma yagouaroundi]